VIVEAVGVIVEAVGVIVEAVGVIVEAVGVIVEAVGVIVEDEGDGLILVDEGDGLILVDEGDGVEEVGAIIDFDFFIIKNTPIEIPSKIKITTNMIIIVFISITFKNYQDF
jgi:hypothetical protein